MVASVYFNYKFTFTEQEVNNVITYNMLPQTPLTKSITLDQ